MSTAGAATGAEDRPALRALLNGLWFVFSGLWLAVLYALAGVIACLLVVTFRWGLASFRLAAYVLWPMAYAPAPLPEDEAGPPWYDPRNLLWLLAGGVWIILAHVVLGLVFAATLIAFFFASEHFKLLPVVVRPRAWTITRDI
ncbi:YccF domain-containing protein [Streptomyces sp. 7-21]|uniref:YccF domain-containing protein n=1 Tax=Streptomyces sp. 7-21 TaxID=2802283 RepID=UPI00191D95F5|nr:YccF domain-containing protein [Streptomyces sp. 7-21]MBL1065527.1 hypothetical protein [Streptomyces sp. 7-21]